MIVFDSSALLAYLLDEPGAELVSDRLEEGGVIGAANWAEVAQKMRTHEAWSDSRNVLLSFPLRIEAVERADAEVAAGLWQQGTRLSLADRLCLALGARLEAQVLTSDRAWSAHPSVRLIR